MHPREYKGKRVLYHPLEKIFVVAGGKQIAKSWFLKDENDYLYPIEDCQLLQINQLEFDLRKLKQINTLADLEKFFEVRGWDRFHEAWGELEKDPVEAAAMAILYCNNWADFCHIADGYGVSLATDSTADKSRRKKFWARLVEKKLDKQVNRWKEEQSATA